MDHARHPAWYWSRTLMITEDIEEPSRFDPACCVSSVVASCKTVMRLLMNALCSLPQNGGAHSAPARERRGASGPRERPSRDVGGAPRSHET